MSNVFCFLLERPPKHSLVMRAAAKKSNINIVAVNDPFIPVEYMEYMYKYDSTHGRAAEEVTHDTASNTVIIDGKPIKIFGEMDPSKIDWVRCEVQLAESRGAILS
jgi:glyceraldehyde-3-phosphate dehydrogenase/erythrose-4-phosphate dehydrogenase